MKLILTLTGLIAYLLVSSSCVGKAVTLHYSSAKGDLQKFIDNAAGGSIIICDKTEEHEISKTLIII